MDGAGTRDANHGFTMRTSICVLAFAAQLVGCGTWTVTTPPLATVELTAAPVADIDVYPNTVYEGRTVYYYDNRWYYRDGARWRYYNEEPRALAARRYEIIAQPPPYVEINAPPVVNIEAYPSAIYAGRPTYYYGNRWYYREGPRWRYYRYEPPPLTTHRNQMQRRDEPRDTHHESHEHYR